MSEANVNSAFPFIAGSAGCLMIAVLGTAPIVHRWLSGVASYAPAAFFARTWSSCWPGSRSSSWYGDTQDVHEAAPFGSSAHSNVVCGSGSFEWKKKLADVL